MNPLIFKISGLVLVVVAIFGFGYRSGSNHVKSEWNAEKLVQAEAAAKAEAANRAKEQSYAKQLENARNEAAKRETALRTDADALRAANDGMRDQLTAIRRQLPSLTADAVRQYADAASAVLSECQARYSTMAETADRLDSERQTLIAAWPK